MFLYMATVYEGIIIFCTKILRYSVEIGIYESINRWLSGEHNSTIATIAMLSTFFGKPIIAVQ